MSATVFQPSNPSRKPETPTLSANDSLDAITSAEEPVDDGIGAGSSRSTWKSRIFTSLKVIKSFMLKLKSRANRNGNTPSMANDAQAEEVMRPEDVAHAMVGSSTGKRGSIALTAVGTMKADRVAENEEVASVSPIAVHETFTEDVQAEGVDIMGHRRAKWKRSTAAMAAVRTMMSSRKQKAHNNGPDGSGVQEDVRAEGAGNSGHSSTSWNVAVAVTAIRNMIAEQVVNGRRAKSGVAVEMPNEPPPEDNATANAKRTEMTSVEDCAGAVAAEHGQY